MTATTNQYELLDFGDGRKLERFGGVILNRPCPTAEDVAKSRPELWDDATARFRGPRMGDGSWSPAPRSWVPAEWHYVHGGDAPFRLQLEALPSGQVGVFPEQRENWDWIAGQITKAKSKLDRPPRVLNLFAYTGGSTLAASAAGAEVVHIDAARNLVDRARENAAFSGFADRPIRWIAEDAVKFCQRELKRGNQYDAVILDPPTFGHGPKGELWQTETGLLSLLKLCGQLTAESRAFVLVTCHSPGIGPAELAAYLAEGIFGHCGQPPKSGGLFLETADARRLPSGTFARWPK
ncbi:MAG: class I SAM-dependent methyltransferase [Planctomycetes bacterium]|nr:class I SAM-dependent methyltransferase [Planctomycetota bacterium]